MSDSADKSSERICSHMNSQHRLALLDYVVVYGNERPEAIAESSLIMTSIDEKQMTIEYRVLASTKPRSIKIAWDNAPEKECIQVKSMSDIKPKLVAMAKYAASQQGFATKRVDTILLPPAYAYLWYMTFISMAINAYSPGIIRRLSAAGFFLRFLAPHMPGLLHTAYNFYERHATAVFFLILTPHVTEVFLLTIPFLRKHRVPLQHKIVWIGMHCFEGYFLFKRLWPLGVADE